MGIINTLAWVEKSKSWAARGVPPVDEATRPRHRQRRPRSPDELQGSHVHVVQVPQGTPVENGGKVEEQLVCRVIGGAAGAVAQRVGELLDVVEVERRLRADGEAGQREGVAFLEGVRRRRWTGEVPHREYRGLAWDRI